MHYTIVYFTQELPNEVGQPRNYNGHDIHTFEHNELDVAKEYLIEMGYKEEDGEFVLPVNEQNTIVCAEIVELIKYHKRHKQGLIAYGTIGTICGTIGHIDHGQTTLAHALINSVGRKSVIVVTHIDDPNQEDYQHTVPLLGVNEIAKTLKPISIQSIENTERKEKKNWNNTIGKRK